jgi:branched-chain amino acid transport system permease protein
VNFPILIQILIDGLVVGSMYALIALGYTLVFGILQFINFAHGDVFALGAWLTYVACARMLPTHGIFSTPVAVAVIAPLTAVVGCGLVGLTIERLAYKPLRNAPKLNVLITAIGVSLLLENAGQLSWIFGAASQRVPQVVSDRTIASVSGVPVSWIDIVIVISALLLMIGMQLLIYRTRLGSAMRAVSINPRAAALMGIPVDRVISITFVIGSALAGAAGYLYSMKYPSIQQPAAAVWVLLGLKAFVAAVVGGIGNVRGAMLGGLLIGVFEFAATQYSSQYADVFVFLLLIGVLLVRPTGLLGSTAVEKV